MANNLTKTPCVFVSYAWTDKEYIDRVIEFSKRLISHGIDVRLDKWDLEIGQDIHQFMEQSVNNANIDKILVLLNKAYQVKANERSGGVGEETLILSPDVYKSPLQKKVIPIVFDLDENGEPCLPTYLKGRLYINLDSNNPHYEQEFDNLLRAIWESPLYVKPRLGEKPVWLDSKNSNFSELNNLISQLSTGTKTRLQKRQLITKVETSFIKKAQEYVTPGNGEVELIYTTISELKPLRDVYLSFLEEIIVSEESYLGSILPDLLESLQNNFTGIVDESGLNLYEVFDYLCWEIAICMVALLWHYELFSEIHLIVNQQYSFLKPAINGSFRQEVGFIGFKPDFRYLEHQFKPHSRQPKLITLAGDLLINQRERLPVLSRKAIVNADILLCQLTNIYRNGKGRLWFPLTYIYRGDSGNRWQKLKSKIYCERILPIFGVDTIGEMKKVIEGNPLPPNFGYPEAFDNCPSITDDIDLNLIGTLP